MAKCFTCEARVTGYQYTCLSCKVEKLQEKIESRGGEISKKLSHAIQLQRGGFKALGNDLETLKQVQQDCFRTLSNSLKALDDNLSRGLSEIASALEWGFEKIHWQLQQQTNVLRSIDRTLKTPAETQANEWRIMADKLQDKGILNEAEEFYLKALESNRLDYRIYVGLAQTYLQNNKFDKAKFYLEKSIPHACREVEEVFNWQSYSYLLIGRIYECEEDYGSAASALRSAVELSLVYPRADYHYARYCALTGNLAECLSSLQKAISIDPFYWCLAHEERSFNPFRNAVEALLSRIGEEASSRANDAIGKANAALWKAHAAIVEAQKYANQAWEATVLDSGKVYNDATAKFNLARERAASGDYTAILEASVIAEESHTLATAALHNAINSIRASEITRATNSASTAFSISIVGLVITLCLWPLSLLLLIWAFVKARNALKIMSINGASEYDRAQAIKARTTAIIGLIILIAVLFLAFIGGVLMNNAK